jgi:hypothetical protein
VSSHSHNTLLLSFTFADNYNKPFYLLWKFDSTIGSLPEWGTQSTKRVSSHSRETLILSFTFPDNYNKPFYLLWKFDSTSGSPPEWGTQSSKGVSSRSRKTWLNQFCSFSFFGLLASERSFSLESVNCFWSYDSLPKEVLLKGKA